MRIFQRSIKIFVSSSYTFPMHGSGTAETHICTALKASKNFCSAEQKENRKAVVGKDWNAHTRLSYGHAPILPFLPCTYTFLLSHHKASRNPIVFTSSTGTAQYSGRNLSTVQFRTCCKSVQPEFVSLELPVPQFHCVFTVWSKVIFMQDNFLLHRGTSEVQSEHPHSCLLDDPDGLSSLCLPDVLSIKIGRELTPYQPFQSRHLGTLCILSPESEPEHPLLFPNLFSQVSLFSSDSSLVQFYQQPPQPTPLCPAGSLRVVSISASLSLRAGGHL